MSRKLVAVAGLVFAIAVAAVTIVVARHHQTIYIGAAVPLDGPDRAQGIGIRNAVQLAIDEQNARGGVNGHKLELIEANSGPDPLSALQQIARNERAVGAVTYYDPECDSQIVVYSMLRMPFLHVGMTECDPGGKNPLLFRFMPVNAELVAQAAHYSWETLHARNFLFVREDTRFGQGTANQFRRGLGVIRHDVIVGLETILKPGTTDFSEAIARARKESDDYITYTGTPPQAGEFIKQAREGGYAGTIQVLTPFPSQETIDAAQGKAEGVLQFFGGLPDQLTEPGKQFEAAYAAHGFRDPPSIFGVYAYANTQALIGAIDKSFGSRPSVLGALQHERGLTTIFGVQQYAKFGEDDEDEKPITYDVVALYKVIGGKWVPIMVTDKNKKLQPYP